MKSFRRALDANAFALSAELTARRGESADEVLSQAERLTDWVDAIQIAETPDQFAQVSPLALSSLLLRQGIDPLPRLTCRDRNRIALQSDLLGLHASGVRSVMLLHGSEPGQGSELAAKPVFDISGDELIRLADTLNEQWVEASQPDLLIGTGTVIPPLDASRDAAWDTTALAARAQAGARFLQTQLCLDMEALGQFMRHLVEEKLTWRFSVVVTLAVVTSAEQARQLLQRHPEILLPESLLTGLESAANPRDEGIAACAECLQQARDLPGISGVNLLTLGDSQAVTEAIERAGMH